MNTNKLLSEFIELIIEGDEIKRSATVNDWRSNNDRAFEEEIIELTKRPEFKTIDTFVSYKLDSDEYSFDTIELQALSRNIDVVRLGHKVNASSAHTISAVKQTLVGEFGFKFTPREPVKFVRGSMSNAHGRHPFAGSGGGGSGFGSDRGGPSHTSFGGGPGAIGGGYAWDPNDKRNLKMGTGKK